MFDLFILWDDLILAIWTKLEIIGFGGSQHISVDILLACLSFQDLIALPVLKVPLASQLSHLIQSLLAVLTDVVSFVHVLFILSVFILASLAWVDFLGERKVLRVLGSCLVVIHLAGVGLELAVGIGVQIGVNIGVLLLKREQVLLSLLELLDLSGTQHLNRVSILVVGVDALFSVADAFVVEEHLDVSLRSELHHLEVGG
jgi:hypothetical protein